MNILPISLGGRLLAGSIVFTLVMILVTLAIMDRVLDRFVTGQINQRLDNKIVALTSQLKIAPDGVIRIEGDADGPPFDKPDHKSFWWVGGPKNNVQTGWLPPQSFTPPAPAQIAAAPPPPGPGDARETKPRSLPLVGPQGVPMHVRALRREFGGIPVTILAAAPLEAIAGPMHEALTTLAGAVLGLGLVLLLAAVALVRLSLRPLAQLQTQIAAVRTGRSALLPSNQPIEIEPLVTELNSLLAQNAESLTRARRHVANLAHGLKTPLATLSLTVDRIDGDDRAAMQGLVGAIERRVRHHLGRARAAALDGPVRAQTRLAERLQDLIETLAKIHADKTVVATLDCAADLALACEPQDVDEMLGNLLENAFKYTRSRVGCRVTVAAATAQIAISDDGPGLSPSEIDHVLCPGQRLDEAVPGHGFGLPIAQELAELYGGALTLVSSDDGLIARLTLPCVR